MNIFHPDSKLMQFVRLASDMIILNVLFVLCSIPVVTIGAAKSGLYTGLRDINDRDGSNSASKSFFKGFKNGFFKITFLWTVLLVAILLLAFCVYYIFLAVRGETAENLYNVSSAPAVVALIGLILLCPFTSQMVLFHSRFDCTKTQLIGNTLTMTFLHPFKSIIIGLVSWLPLIVSLIDRGYLLIQTTPLWVAIYFSLSANISYSLMKKPFEKIIYPDGKPEEDKKDDNEEE